MTERELGAARRRQLRGLAVGTALLVGFVASAAACTRPSPFEAAKEACAPTVANRSSYVTVLDGGAALDISGEGKESKGAKVSEVACLLGELDVPQSVIARISRTRALDGTQAASWGEFSASWTYHPNSGLNIILEREG